jgi:superfamily I DNA and RNA helicase
MQILHNTFLWDLPYLPSPEDQADLYQKVSYEDEISNGKSWIVGFASLSKNVVVDFFGKCCTHKNLFLINKKKYNLVY